MHFLLRSSRIADAAGPASACENFSNRTPGPQSLIDSDSGMSGPWQTDSIQSLNGFTSKCLRLSAELAPQLMVQELVSKGLLPAPSADPPKHSAAISGCIPELKLVRCESVVAKATTVQRQCKGCQHARFGQVCSSALASGPARVCLCDGRKRIRRQILHQSNSTVTHLPCLGCEGRSSRKEQRTKE